MREFSTGKITHGLYPWNAQRQNTTGLGYSASGACYGSDTPAQISACLGCKLHRCINCLDPKNINRKRNYKPRTRMKEEQCRRTAQFKELFEKNLSKREICEQLSMSSTQYYRFKRKILEEIQL